MPYGVECLVVDDAHDLSMPHLIFLKELTDQLTLAYPPYVLGVCLVTAGRGAAIPLKEVFDQPETMWLQFRHRFDRVHPYCRVVNHTEAEVRAILLALAQMYRPSFLLLLKSLAYLLACEQAEAPGQLLKSLGLVHAEP